MVTEWSHTRARSRPAGRVVDLERQKVEVLAGQLLPVLRERGSLSAETVDLDDVERWRRAVRRAARLLGWKVRTGVTPDGSRAWAFSDDFPMTEAERREAAERVSAAIGWSYETDTDRRGPRRPDGWSGRSTHRG